MLKFILIIVVFLNLFLSFFVISQNKKSWNNRLFSLLSFLAAIWTFENYLTGVYSTPFWLQSTYATGALVIASGLVWTFFLTDRFFDKKKNLLIFLISLFFFINSFLDGFIAEKYEKIYLGGAFVGKSGLGLLIYALFFLTAIILILYKLFIAQKKEANAVIKKRLLYVFYGASATLIISFLTSFILPIFSIFSFSGLDSIGFLIFLSFIAYAITKHQLFNIKVIAAELLTFAIWVAILFEFFIEDTLQGRIITGGLFVFTIIAGILLIRSVIKEVHQKEIFKDLSENLEVAKTQLEMKTIRLTALQSFTASITKTLDYEKIIQEIVDDIYHKLGYASALLLLISEDRKKIYPMTISENPLSSIGLKILPKPLKEYYGDFEHDDMLSIKAAKTGILQKGDSISDFISPPVSKSACSAIQIATGIKSLVAVPVKEEEKSIGVLNIFLTKPKEKIDNDELELMQTLADQVGIVMKNATLYKQLKEINEKLTETDKLKTGMFSFVSHQIKAPISIVKGFAQLIYDGKYGKIPKKVKETVGLVKESADRLIHLTEDFLDLRKIEEGKMDYEFTDVNIVDMAKSIIQELQLLANQKKLELSFESLAKNIEVKADEQRLRQVFQNLIENCIKYTEKGFVKVEIKQEKNGEVLFSVIDSGIGIAPDVLPTLFDQFKRAQAARTIKGTGLGLYIAKQIVEAHKGKIWAESGGEGKGSGFFVRLNKVG